MREKNRLLALTIVTLTGILGALMITGASLAGPIIIKYADPSKAGSARTKAAEDTMLEIEKRTAGRIKHEFYWSESLLKAKDVLKGIQGGTCDAGDTTAIQYHPARFPVWQFIQIPFITGDDAYAVTKANNDLYEANAQLRQEFDEQGVVLLSTSSLTPTVISAARSIKTRDDFKGLRIRAIGGMAKWVAAMGGVPVPLPIYEANEALARGVIDGTQSYIYATHSYKFYEQCKFQPLNGISHIFVEYVINKAVLEKMPDDIAKIYLETWRAFYPERLAKYTEEERTQQIKDFQAAGVTVYTVSADELAEWKKAAQPLYEEYFQAMQKKGIDGKAVLEQYQALYRKYEGKK